MTRTFAFVVLAVLLAGCSRYHSRAQGPFAPPKKEPPPPYGAVAPPPPKPIANQSPLGIASADPAAPVPPDDRPLIPPRAGGVVPAGGTAPADGGAPPKRKQPPEALPSPFAPKEPPRPAAGNAPAAPKADQPKAAANDLAPIKGLLAVAGERWKAVDTFEAQLTRREVGAKGGPRTSEVLLYQLRREPLALFTRNVSPAGKGREVVYNPSKHGDKIYVMLGEGDHKWFKAGFVAPAMSPDDPNVTEKARYSVRDSGFGRPLKVLADAAAKVEAGKAPADSLAYRDGVRRDECPSALVAVTHKLRPGDDPLMPAGGTRQYFFDADKKSPAYGLPVLTVATDAKGQEVEYYLFAKVKSPAGLTDADFNPARLGKK